jgi:type IV pilus assembly protein PilC
MSTSPASSDALEIGAKVTSLAAAEVPLGPALRAAAQESPKRRVAAGLVKIAEAVERGESLEAALKQELGKLPPHIGSLLVAGAQGARLREALLDVVEHDEETQETLRTVYSALAYPVLLLILAYACFVFIELYLVHFLLEMYREFELELPATTKVIAQISELSWWLIIVPPSAVVLGSVLLALLKRSWRQRVVATIPLIGNMFHWCGVAQATRALGHLVRQQQPLPAALRISSQGLRDANVAEVWNQLADEVESGRALSAAMLANHRLPASIAPLVHWGERTAQLPDALIIAAEMLEGRAELRAQLVRTIFPPMMFILIAGGSLFVAMALLTPLVSLITNLSG